MRNSKRNEVRCFKDDAVMQPIEGHPGWIRCPVCQFVTQLIDYDADDVRQTFDDLHRERLEDEDEQPDPHDGALYPWGHLAPLGRQDKRGGGSKSGRRRKRKYVNSPAPKWTIA